MEILTPTILWAPDNPELIGGCVPRSVQVKEEKNMQERGSGWACQGERYGKQSQRDKRAEWQRGYILALSEEFRKSFRNTGCDINNEGKGKSTNRTLEEQG